MITDKTGRRGGAPKSQAAVDAELAALRAMTRFAADRARCRRAIVLEYFGERDFDPAAGCGGLCDNCADGRPVERRDLAEHGRGDGVGERKAAAGINAASSTTVRRACITAGVNALLRARCSFVLSPASDSRSREMPEPVRH